MIINQINNKLKKFGYEKLFLFLIFFYLIVSINSPPYFYKTFDGIISTISYFRGISPYVLFPILIGYIIYFKKEIKFDICYLLFFAYLFFQFIGYITFDESILTLPPSMQTIMQNDGGSLYWLVSGITAALFFYIIREDKKLNIFLLKFFLVIITIIASASIISLYKEFYQLSNIYSGVFSFDTKFFYSYDGVSPTTYVGGQPVPRSSGLARILLIIILFIFVNYIYSNKSKLKTFIYAMLAIFIMFTLLQLQNRLVLYFIILFIPAIFFIKIYNLNYKSKILLLIFAFIIPYFFHIIEHDVRNFYAHVQLNQEETKLAKKEAKDKIIQELSKIANEEAKDEIKKELSKIDVKGEDKIKIIEEVAKLLVSEKDKIKIIDEIKKELSTIDVKGEDKIQIIEEITKLVDSDKNKDETIKVKSPPTNYNVIDVMSKSHAAQTIKHQRVLSSSSSGRLVLWKASIYYLKQNYLGYGPQADRKLLSANVSNLFIYSMLCGGVISFASIFIFSIIIFVKSAKLIFVQKVQAHKEKFLVFSLLLIAFFGLKPRPPRDPAEILGRDTSWGDSSGGG